MIALAQPTTTWYLVLAALVFSIGTVGVMVRRNPLVMFMCVELMLNAVNLSFVALARDLGDISGQTTVFFGPGNTSPTEVHHGLPGRPIESIGILFVPDLAELADGRLIGAEILGAVFEHVLLFVQDHGHPGIPRFGG